MTLKVYSVTATGERSTSRTREYRPDTNAPPDLNVCWPPCVCLRCRRGGKTRLRP